MQMLQIEVRAVSADGRRQAVRQRVIDVPVKFVKKPAWLERYYGFARIRTTKQKVTSVPLHRCDEVIIASSKGGYTSKMMSRKDQDSCFRTIDHKRQHKPDHRRVDVYH
jgi:hypothetical protein